MFGASRCLYTYVYLSFDEGTMPFFTVFAVSVSDLRFHVRCQYTVMCISVSMKARCLFFLSVGFFLFGRVGKNCWHFFWILLDFDWT